jgi:hypothetical protein
MVGGKEVQSVHLECFLVGRVPVHFVTAESFQTPGATSSSPLHITIIITNILRQEDLLGKANLT